MMAHIHLYKILLGLFASVDLSLIFSAEDPGDHAKLRAGVGCCWFFFCTNRKGLYEAVSQSNDQTAVYEGEV